MKTINIIFGLLACFILFASTPRATAVSAAWTELGTNPAAADQPTERAQAIRILQGWNGKLYMGYGDVDQNIGPIDLYSYTPKTRTFAKERTLRTEIINNFCPIGDRLFVPLNRPFRTNDPAYAVCDSSGQWSNASISMDIASDMATLTGTDLWLTGASDERGVALRSLDGGETWEESLKCNHVGDESCRYSYAVVLNDKLHVQCSISKTSMVFDGDSWTTGPFIAPFAKKSEHLQKQLMILFRGRIAFFDGENPSLILGISDDLGGLPIQDCAVSGDAILGLFPHNRLIMISRKRGGSWEEISIPPQKTYCMAILDGKLYVGTKDSKLYVYNGQLPPEFR